MKLTIRKYDPNDSTKFHIDEAGCLYSSTTYDVSVFAPDFAADQTSACTLKLLRRQTAGAATLTEYASCNLIADPYRRNRRAGTLLVNDTAHAALWSAIAPTDMRNIDDQFVLSVQLGSGASHVIYAQVPVVIAPSVVQSGT